MKNFLYKIYFISIFLAVIGQSSFGQNSEPYLLIKQQISGNRTIEADELLSLLPEKPNTKFLWLFRLKLGIYKKNHRLLKKQNWLAESKKYEKEIDKAKQQFEVKSKNFAETSSKYQKLKQKRDKLIEKNEKKITEGNWFLAGLGEPPVYFYEADAIKNTEKLTKYLKNNGFFNAKVSFLADSNQSKKRVVVTYLVSENIAYNIKNIKQYTDDTKLQNLLSKYSNESKLIVGKRFNEEDLTAERLRIETILKNNGYYLFNRNLIKYKVNYLPNDPNGGVQISMYISPSKEGENEKIFEIGKVEFIVDASENEKLETNTTEPIKVDTTINKDITYLFIGKKFSTKYLYKKIFLRPNELYSQTNQFETQKALQNLDQFKFANPSFDTTGSKLNVRIYAIPLEKYQFTGETGMNVYQGIPGPFANLSVKVRNITGGLESLENTFRFGLEGQTSFGGNSSRQRSIETGFNTAVNIPQLLLPWSFTRLDKFSPKTLLGIGLNYADRQDYRRLNFRLAANYSWNVEQKKQYNFSLLDLNVINTTYLSPAFDSTLNALKTLQGNNLKDSFGKSFVSSISGSYIYNDNFLGQNQKGKYIRVFGEFGGNMLNFSNNGELNFLNKILGNNLNYFKYIRLLGDYRRFIALGNNHKNIFAYRINTGIALSYNKNSEALPYEKYLFAGGSYSLRAWEPRRLGLNNFGQNQEQPGNLLIESSVEYRFPITKLYGQLNGAFFVDMGNVWTIKKPGIEAKASDFKLNNMINQLAVDTGFGVRYDFTYFVIRLDWAAKVFEPINGAGKKYVFDDFFMKNKDPNYNLKWNIGIGYPF